MEPLRLLTGRCRRGDLDRAVDDAGDEGLELARELSVDSRLEVVELGDADQADGETADATETPADSPADDAEPPAESAEAATNEETEA